MHNYLCMYKLEQIVYFFKEKSIKLWQLVYKNACIIYIIYMTIFNHYQFQVNNESILAVDQ